MPYATVVSVVALCVAACGQQPSSTPPPSPSPPPKTFDAEGYVGIPSPYFTFNHALTDFSCDPTGKWAGVHASLPVTVTHDGNTVAESELDSGFNTIRSCQFNFTLKGVPELPGDYVVTVGDQLRETLTVDQLKVHPFPVTTG